MPLLHLAAESGFLSATDHLCAGPPLCPVDLRSRDGSTALHAACGRFGGDRIALKLLHAHGADVNAADEDGWTPVIFDDDYEMELVASMSGVTLDEIKGAPNAD